MNNEQFELGYTPKNLRDILKLKGLTQSQARELVGKAKSTFGRYLYDIDHPEHVSMSHQDWVSILHQLNISYQLTSSRLSRLTMRNRLNRDTVNCLDGLPSFTKLFIGARDVNGRYLPQLTTENTKQEFLDFCKDILQMDGERQDGSIYFAIDVERVLSVYMKEILKKMGDRDQILFNRLIEYDRDGVIASFKSFYNQIIKSNFKESDKLIMDILRISSHFMKEFLNTKGYYRNPQYDINQQFSKCYVSDIDEVEESFTALINSLVMCMTCVYYGDKKNYHNNNAYITDSIRDMMSHLSEFFNIDIGLSQGLFKKYIIETAFFNPDKLEYMQNVLGLKINAIDLAAMIKESSTQGRDDYKFGYFYLKTFQLNIMESDEVSQFFDRIIKIYGILNFVSEMDAKLASFSAGFELASSDLQVQAELKVLLECSGS